jgi:hypothetical protein
VLDVGLGKGGGPSETVRNQRFDSLKYNRATMDKQAKEKSSSETDLVVSSENERSSDRVPENIGHKLVILQYIVLMAPKQKKRK